MAYVIADMFPPAQGLRLDIDAISQIFGSISIACWIGECQSDPVSQGPCRHAHVLVARLSAVSANA